MLPEYYNQLTGEYDIVDLTNSLKLSDIMESLPKNCIFLKGKPGCGGTTLALHSSEKYLILMPYISNVKNKEVSEEGAFVYTGNYSQITHGVTKICATYESLSTLIRLIKPSEWNLVVDEYHILCNSYNLRQEAFQAIKDNFNKFKSYCFMSATPPAKVLGFLKFLKIIKLNWIGYSYTIKWVDRCLSLQKYLKQNSFYIEKASGQNEEKCNHFIFYNSVRGIEKIVQEFGITDYQVFMSENNKNTTLRRGNIQEPRWCTYNFFTSTCFESIDIFVKNPKVWILMNEKNIHTICSQETCQQILGRFRGTILSEVRVVSEMGKISLPDGGIEECKKQFAAAKGLQIVADIMGTSFCWLDYQQNFPYLLYKNGDILPNVEAYEFTLGIINTINSYKKFNFRNFIYKETPSGKIPKNVTLEERIKNISNFPEYKYYSLIQECISQIGIENTLKCKSIKALRRALTDPSLLPSKQLARKLAFSSGFYNIKTIKRRLQEVGIFGPASRICEFYSAHPEIRKINGTTCRGYYIN